MHWVDESGSIVAIAGGGGYGDSTDDVERNANSIDAVYPLGDVDSGNDTLRGNGERDFIAGGAGAIGEWDCCIAA